VRPLTRILLIALLAVAAFAAWVWFRPYEWRPDPAARYEIRQVQLTPDHGSCWLDVILERTGDADHDFKQAVFLSSSRGWRKTNGDFTMGGKQGEGAAELSLRFWLDPGDLDGTLKLHLNGGELVVKANPEAPDLSGHKVFLSSRW
jgi:hypothetical protein